MAQEPMDFAEFYAAAKDDCLRAVLASTGDLLTAEDLVAEALGPRLGVMAHGQPTSGTPGLGGPDRP